MWSNSSFPALPGILPGLRRAIASLVEVLIPRNAIVRSLNNVIMSVPSVPH